MKTQIEVDNLSILEMSQVELRAIQGGSMINPRVWKLLYESTVGYVVGEILTGIDSGLARKCPPCK